MCFIIAVAIAITSRDSFSMVIYSSPSDSEKQCYENFVFMIIAHFVASLIIERSKCSKFRPHATRRADFIDLKVKEKFHW